ncbi:MAG: type II toxin-antitoxin system Phd/YefM family antitoxin [Candidatus Omnitrophota bacterium]
MRFITIRDLRSKSAQIQRQLPKEKEMVLTSNGSPVAILSAVSGDTLEELLSTIRRARTMIAATYIQKCSAKLGKDRISLKEINEEIAAQRKARKRK